MVSQVEEAMKGIPYQGNSMYRGGVRELAHLRSYKRLDIGMFEGVLRCEAGSRSCREAGFF